MDQPCIYCKSASDDYSQFGKFQYHSGSGLRFHKFCRLLSNGTYSKEDRDDNFFTQPEIEEILRDVDRSQFLLCSYCGEAGATISCMAYLGCETRFHLTCGIINKALSYLTGNFLSLCRIHRLRPNFIENGENFCNDDVLPPAENDPRPDLIETEDEANIENDENKIQCFACLSVLYPPFEETSVLHSDCCYTTYGHKVCYQKLATNAGFARLKCPGCNNVDRFRFNMKRLGIYIPVRIASWETTVSRRWYETA